MPNSSLLLASLLFAGLQVPATEPSGPASWQNPITVQLMTVVDHPDVLGGQRVRVPVAQVKHVIGPRLVVVSEPRLVGIDRTYRLDFRFDKLLVLLPAGSALSRGQSIAVTGVVRTVAGARAAGLMVDDDAKQARKQLRWTGKAVLLVADSVETLDGVALIGRR